MSVWDDYCFNGLVIYISGAALAGLAAITLMQVKAALFLIRFCRQTLFFFAANAIKAVLGGKIIFIRDRKVLLEKKTVLTYTTKGRLLARLLSA